MSRRVSAIAACGLLVAACSVATAHAMPVAIACEAAESRSLLAAADAAMAKRDFRAGNARLDEALASLGSRYRTSAMIDDTGMHLTLANIQLSKGKLRQAAVLKRRVLAERLELCAAQAGQRH